MAEAVLMPQVGISVESCIITEWLKKPGDAINVGDILFSYETDKSSLECESTAAGSLLDVFFQDGDEVPVLTAVCAIGQPGEDISSLRPAGEESAAVPAPASAESVVPDTTSQKDIFTPASTGVAGEKGKVSPRAKNLAQSQHVDLNFASATGPNGRVIERDVRSMIEQGVGIMTSAAYGNESALSTGTGIGGRVAVGDLGAVHAPNFAAENSQAPYEDVVFTGIRKAISKSMTQSLSTIPQLTHNFHFDATELQAYRSKLKSSGESLGLPNITLNDFILFAVSRLLLKYPALNAHMLDANTIRYFSDVHLGMAVDTPKGLLVPVISYANRKSLSQIASEAKSLAKAAQEGSISPDQMSGGSFTISNLGVFGVDSFTPVINPPQTGILGVDTINQQVRVVDNEITVYPSMGISLTYDHRAIDGAPASKFAQELCKTLENFTVLLAQ